MATRIATTMPMAAATATSDAVATMCYEHNNDNYHYY